MSSNQAAQNAQGSDLLKTMLMKQIQQSQGNSGPSSASAMQGGSRMGIRPGLIKREPGQHPMRPQAVQSAMASGVTSTQSMANAQSMPPHGHNPMSVLASMTQQNMSRPLQMSSSQPQQQMPLGQQQQQVMRVSSPQMTPRNSVPRMQQNLTPQQQAMMMRFQQQQIRQQQMQAGGRPPGPFPGQMINRPRMPMIKQEPGTGVNPQMVPQQKETSGNLNRGPMPANVRPPHGPSGVQAPMPSSPGIRGIPPVRIKQEGVPNSGTTQRQLPGLGAQYPAQGQMMGNQPPRLSQHGLPPGSQGNPQAGMIQGSMMGRDQPVQQNMPSQRQARGQMRPRMQQPTGPMPRLQGQVQDMNFMNPRVPMAGLHSMQHKQMNSRPVRPSLAPSSMSDKNVSLGASASQSQSTSFMQMLTDDSDLMNLMSTQSQYTGVGGLGQNQVYSSSGVRPGGPPNTSAGNVSFMQLLLNDSRTPPPDPSDQRQNYMTEQQVPNQMRMPMPTPPMSDPMSGSPNEFVGNQLNRGNMHPVSSGVSSQMSSNGMPFQSGVRECHLPPPYPGGSSIPPQRPGGRNQNNIMYPSSTTQMYSGQQGMSHMGQHQMGTTQMSMSGGASAPFNLHQQQLGNQGLQPYDQGFPNPMGHSQHGGVNQQLPFARDPVADPFSPSIIPPNRDISLNPPQEARVQGMMERPGEYMDMDNMHEDMVEPIVIAPIDERIASKMDRCNARQDMMSLQNMVSRLENQEQGSLPPANQNVPLPPVANIQRCDPLYNAAENRSPDVQLVSVRGEFNLHSVPVVEDKPPRSNLSAKSHKLLKSMKKLKLVLKKIDLKGRTTVKLGRKKSKRKDKERRKRRRKEHRSKKWRHIDRSHIYERRRKKRESISVSSDSETEDSEYERRRRRKRRRHSERRRKRRSLSSDGSYVSEDDLDMGCRPKKRRTRAKKPQYYLGSDDEFEYENSLTGYMSFETPFDIAWTETSLGSKFRSKKDKDESDLEFDPGEFTSVEEEYSSDASSTDSDTAASDSDETRSGREIRISKKKQTSLKVAQRFRSSSSDEVNETFLFDSDDEEYTPAVMKRGRKSQSRSGSKRKRMSSASSAADESSRKKKKRQKKNLKRKRKALIFSSDGEDVGNEQVLEKPQKATIQKKSAKSGKQDVPIKNVKSGKQDVPVKGNSPNKVKAKPAAKSTSKGGKRVKADSTKNTVETRVTRRRSASVKISSQENESESTVTRRTRSQLRRDSLNQGSKTPDADKASNVVSTSEEVSADKNAQNYEKSCDSQAEVSSTSENPRKESDFSIPDCDQSPKEVTSTSESKKSDDEKPMGSEPECQTVPEDNPVSSVAIVHDLCDINTKSPKVVLRDIFLNEPVVSGSVHQTEDVLQVKANSDERKELLLTSSKDELSADNEAEKEQHAMQDQEASKNTLDEKADNTTDACDVAFKNKEIPADDDSLKPQEENTTECEKTPADDDSLKQLKENTTECEKTPAIDDSLKHHEENTVEYEKTLAYNDSLKQHEENTAECEKIPANDDSLKQHEENTVEENTAGCEKTPANDDSLKRHEENTVEENTTECEKTPANDDSLKWREENTVEYKKTPANEDSLKRLEENTVEENTAECEKIPANDDSLKQHEENTTECELSTISNTQTESTDCNTICSGSGANVDKSEVTGDEQAGSCVDGLSGTPLEDESNKESCDAQKDPEMLESTPRLAAEELDTEEPSQSDCKEKDESPNMADCGSEKTDSVSEKNNCGSENYCGHDKTDCVTEKSDCDSKEGDISETTEDPQAKTSEETPGDTKEPGVLGSPSPTQRIIETPEETSG